MSGGVDSSMAAVRLVEEGYEVIGATFLHGLADRQSENDQVADAKAVAGRLGIRHETIDCSERFRRMVIEPFVEAYCAGLTPNPCFRCNPNMKFRLGIELADRVGAQWLATGHYARIVHTSDGPRLACAADQSKDQSYFLAGLPPSMLTRLYFPLGELTKNEVRELARKHELPISEKAESQEICFVGAGDVHSFFADRDLSESGDIVDREGSILGGHRGVVHYTVGQRRGLGLAGGPYYVMALDAPKNQVIVGRHGDLYASEVRAIDSNYLAPIDKGVMGKAKIRSQHEAAECCVTDASGETFTVRFSEPQWGVAPGQALVVYDDDCVIAGGVIESWTPA